MSNQKRPIPTKERMLIDFFLSYLLIKYVLAKIPFVRTLMGMV